MRLFVLVQRIFLCLSSHHIQESKLGKTLLQKPASVSGLAKIRKRNLFYFMRKISHANK